MGLRQFLRQRRNAATHVSSQAPDDDGSVFGIDYDVNGVNFRAPLEVFQDLQAGRGSAASLDQFGLLTLLVEDECAVKLPNGFHMPSSAAVRLDAEAIDILDLPDPIPGRLETEVSSNTTSRRYAMTAFLELEEWGQTPVQRMGPVVQVGDDDFLLSPRELAVLEAIEKHQALPADERTEHANVQLVALIQAVRETPEAQHPLNSIHQDVQPSLGALENFKTSIPEDARLAVQQNPDKSLSLYLDLGLSMSAEDFEERMWQLDEGDILRVDNHLVLLEDKIKRAAKSVGGVRIPAKDVPGFLAHPEQVLDPDLINLDLSFGVRVEAIGALVPVTFTDLNKSDIDWLSAANRKIAPEEFASRLTAQSEVEDAREKADEAWTVDSTTMAADKHVVDISDHERTTRALNEAENRILRSAAETEREITPSPIEVSPWDQVTVGMIIAESADAADDLHQRIETAATSYQPDLTGLKFTPHPHQSEGIVWMGGLMLTSLDRQSSPRVQGALLADDMGLGKTFMTLVALRNFSAEQVLHDGVSKPHLVVLPLGLIENWEDEMRQAFDTPPFDDVVVLQSQRDLDRFRLDGAKPETKVRASTLDDEGRVKDGSLRLSLRVGEPQGEQRLDQPGRLVLTTYGALARYQLSLGQVEWGAVVFDEAQTMKNPETLVSRAAKGLKADFKLLATGTPVENSLKDMWNLLDTAQPGLMGTWPGFRGKWVLHRHASDDRSDSGYRLREAIGNFMLRRSKQDSLEGLPNKLVHTGRLAPAGDDTVHDERLAVLMPAEQRQAYDQVLQQHPKGNRGAALKTLQDLRSVSLHPSTIARKLQESSPEESARLLGLFAVLDAVKERGEKVVVFVINKILQRRLAMWIQNRYGLLPHVVNGDTAATSGTKTASRKEYIADFEAQTGFNVIILSPLAVGVGLTVVGANHAVHVERHWNPAKEAQATDRIYRIGQTKDVHVYLPLALHPELTSFDLNLDELLQSKTDLKDAVVVPGTVESELERKLGL